MLSIGYRKPPEHRFPAATDDIDTVLGWLERQPIDGPVGDPRRLAPAPTSPSSARCATRAGSPRVVLIYPFLDPTAGFDSYAAGRGERLRRGARRAGTGSSTPTAADLDRPRPGAAELRPTSAPCRRRSSRPRSTTRCATRARSSPAGSRRRASRTVAIRCLGQHARLLAAPAVRGLRAAAAAGARRSSTSTCRESARRRLRECRHARAPRLRPCRPRTQGPPLTWLVDHGYEPVDHGPFVYDALDDYPVLLPPGGRGRRRRPGRGTGQPRRRHRRLGQRRADRRQQGRGHPLRPRLVRGDRGAGPRAQRRQRRLGRRPHALGRGHDPLRGGLPHDPVQRATSGTCAGSARCRRTTRPASCRRCRSPPSRALRRRRGCLRATPSAGSPTTSTRRSPASLVRVGSPQGRFAADAARRSTAPGCSARTPPASTCSSSSSGDRLRPRPPRPDRQVRRAAPASRRCRPGRTGAAADRARRRIGVRRPARAPPSASWSAATRRDEILARLGPDPLRADADPDRAWRRITRSHRPIGDLLMDQAVLAGVGNVYRAEVLFRHRMHPLRPGQHPARRASGGRCGPTSSS